MKKTSRKLSLSRLSLRKLDEARGAYYVGSYGDGCSDSCNTCDGANLGCYVSLTQACSCIEGCFVYTHQCTGGNCF